jgi:hypothetical protein
VTRCAYIRPLLLSAAAYTLAGGYVHLRAWLDVYRHVPTQIPGAWVVRLGFPSTAAASVVLAAALALAATRFPKLAIPAVAATTLFQIGSLGVLVATRVGSAFGWTESGWTGAAGQIRAAEAGALAMLGLTAVYMFVTRTRTPAPALDSPRVVPLAAA